jgi:hypothetical protein
MFKKVSSVVICAAVLGMAANVWAADKDWTNGGGDRLWRTSSNWSGGTPTSSDKAAIRNNWSTNGPIIDSSTTAVANEVVIGDHSSTTDVLTMTGGSLTTSGTSPWIILGYGNLGNSTNGTINISGGTITVGSTLYIGFYDGTYGGTGNLNMTGGTINVTGAFGIAQGGSTSHGTVNLHGGTINCGSFSMGSSFAAMDITTGTLIIGTNMDSTIGTYITSGWITASGGGTINHDYNITNPGKTTVWVTSGPTKAANPSPANSATNVAKNATLSWTAGTGAVSHNVYFGTTSPGASQGNQTETTFNPGILELNTIYYWRIDEVNGPNTVTGDVWSFTTMSGQAKNPDPASSATNVALNKILRWTPGPDAASHDVYFGTNSSDVTNAGLLLGDLDRNGIVNWDDAAILTESWLLDPTGTEPCAGVNSDSTVDLADYALLADNWTDSVSSVFQGNQDANSFDPGALALNTTYYWRVDEVNSCDTSKGNVWSFTTQSGKAYNPSPTNGASGVATSATLSWSAAAGATSHDVYFGTANPPASQGNQTATTFNPGTLANSTTYYWRIDEVGGSGTVTGDVWSFATVPLNSTPIYQYLTWRNDPTNSVVVNWYNSTADGDSTVDYGLTSSYGSSVNVATVTRYHHVELTGLTAGQTYHYRARSSDGTTGTDATYIVPTASPSSFRFAVYGDPRSTNQNNQYYARHQALCNWILAQNYDFALETGDTVWAGATYSPPQPTEYSLTVYWPDFFMLESNLSKSKVIMATLGNHEVQDAQDPTNYENFYSEAFPSNGISGNYGRNYSFNYGNAHFVCLSSYELNLNTEATWLTTDLAAARGNPNITWIFAFMHAPMYTTSGHAGRTDEIASWGPIFDTYHVDIVFAGHNHVYERSKSLKAGAVVADGTGTVYLTTGLGGAEFNSTSSSSLFASLYTGQTLAACVTITGNQLTLQAITNADNVVRDTFTLSK